MRLMSKGLLAITALLLFSICIQQIVQAGNNSPCGVTCTADTHYGLPCPAEISCGSCWCCGCTCEPPPADITLTCDLQSDPDDCKGTKTFPADEAPDTWACYNCIVYSYAP